MTEPRSGRRLPARRPPLSSGGRPLGRLTPSTPFSATVALVAAFALLLALYLWAENPLLLGVVVAAAVVGVDRLLRMHPQARFHGAGATLLYLFVPGLYALGAGLRLA